MILFALVGVVLLIVGALRAKNNPKVLWLVGLVDFYCCYHLASHGRSNGGLRGYVFVKHTPLVCITIASVLNEESLFFPNVHGIRVQVLVQ